jgi:hypothetical protein
MRKHPWDKIDPMLFDGKTRMADIAREFKIGYRSITNRKYQVRDRLKKLMASKKKKDQKAYKELRQRLGLKKGVKVA